MGNAYIAFPANGIDCVFAYKVKQLNTKANDREAGVRRICNMRIGLKEHSRHVNMNIAIERIRDRKR